MKYQNQIIISLSFAIALCYCLPWIALTEQVRLSIFTDRSSYIPPRVLFLFSSVFVTSILFFYSNQSLKDKWKTLRQPFSAVATMLSNVLLIIIASLAMVVIARQSFGLAGGKAYLIIYIFRNLSIAVIVILIGYVLELINRLRVEKIEVLTLRNKHSESELAALRSQIDPHFLFNTLTTLSGLARTKSPETVLFIDHLAETFRYMLENRENKKVTVREELHFLESYLFMIRKRFEQGIDLDLKVNDAVMHQLIPQFALQIAVENAIKHNIISSKHVLHIQIISKSDSISVINNLQKKRTQFGYGLGLKNLSQRYSLIAKKNITIKADHNTFELNLPLL